MVSALEPAGAFGSPGDTRAIDWLPPAIDPIGGHNGDGGQFGGGGGGAGGTWVDTSVLSGISYGTATAGGTGSVTLTWLS